MKLLDYYVTYGHSRCFESCQIALALAAHAILKTFRTSLVP